jgi:tetratricopeptide (TPR) repeat protein
MERLNHPFPARCGSHPVQRMDQLSTSSCPNKHASRQPPRANRSLSALAGILLIYLGALVAPAITSAANVKVIVAEATYVMGDTDSLAAAEENVLLRAKRKAVEEAGVYIEAAAEDRETDTGEKLTRINSLGVRTIAAAVTETQILDKYRTFENDRLVFYVKIQATVHLDWLQEAVKRLKSDEQLAENHRKLHGENIQLKSQIAQLRQQLQEANAHHLDPVPSRNNRRAASDLTHAAILNADLSQKIDLASRAIAADDRYVDAYIVRGQTYLRVASLAVSKLTRPEINRYVERGIADFNRALELDPKSLWALLGRGDAQTWQRRVDEAARDYQHILKLDPLFDVARQRLISLYTTLAKKQAAARQWRQALVTLHKVLPADGTQTQSWVAQEKDAYLLRSRIYTELGDLNRAAEDLTTFIRVDPTNAEAFLLRGELYRRLMQGRLAKDDLERACLLGAEAACTAAPSMPPRAPLAVGAEPAEHGEIQR